MADNPWPAVTTKKQKIADQNLLPPGDLAKPGPADLKKPKKYTASDVRDMPSSLLIRQDTWRRSDAPARAEIRDRAIEFYAQTMPEDLVATLRDNAKKYPQMSPGALQGMVEATWQYLPRPSTTQQYSDQGEPISATLGEMEGADVSSRAAEGTYGGTANDPAPQTGNVPSLTDINIPEGAMGGGEFTPPGEEPSFMERNIKSPFNNLMNALFFVPQALSAASETSAGNETIIREGMKKWGLTPEQAAQVYGEQSTTEKVMNWIGSGGAPESNNVFLNNWVTNRDYQRYADEGVDDTTVPSADPNMSEEQRIAKAKAEWAQHLADSGQINPENGEKSFYNITGRTTLGQQVRTGEMRGGWFGGGSEFVERERTVLGYKQSDMGTYAEREKQAKERKEIADSYRQIGIDIDNDDLLLAISPRTWTEGRALTRVLNMTPGTVAENAVSGAVDLVMTLGTDPASYIPGKWITTGASKASKGAATALRKIPGPINPHWGEVDDAFRGASKNKGGTAKIPSVANIGTRESTAAKPTPFERIDRFQWDKDAGGFVLKDAAGNIPPNAPRLTLTRTAERYEGGYRIEKTTVQGPRGGTRVAWEVTDPWGATQQFTRRADARAHVAGEGGGTMHIADEYTWGTGRSGDLQTAQREARQEFLEMNRIPQVAVTANKTMWDWLDNSYTGSLFVNAVSKMSSPTEIWLRSGRRIPIEYAELMANATTPAQVRAVAAEIFGTRVTSGAAVKNFLGKGVRARSYNTRMALANSKYTKRLYAAGQMAPKAIPVDMNNLEEVVDTAFRFGTAARMKPEEIIPFVDRMIAEKSNWATFNTFHDDLVLTGVRNHLVDNLGIDAQRVDALLSKMRSARKGSPLPKARKPVKERTRKEAMATAAELTAAYTRHAGGAILDDSVANGTFIKGIGDEVALFNHETFASHLVLPTAREMRREANKIAIVLRKGDTPEKAVDFAYDVASRGLDMWRNLTLMNVSYIFRNIAEEVMTMGLYGAKGLLTHPIQAIGTMLSVHAAQQYSSGFSALSNATSRYIPMIRAHRNMRYNPEKYQGVRFVKADALRGILSPGQTNSVLAADTVFRTAKGRKTNLAGFTDDVGRGVVEPITVTVDYGNGLYAVTDGAKRVHAALGNVDAVPVRIVPGKVQGGWKLHAPNTNDAKHADLFGAANVYDDMDVTYSRAQDAVNGHLGWKLALRYLMPYFDQNLARANGKSMYAALERAVRTGDDADIDKIAGFSTRLYGSQLLEEHPDKVFSSRRIFDKSGNRVKIVYAALKGAAPDVKSSDFLAFVDEYADVLGDLAATGEVRRYLAGEVTIDELVEEVMSNPRKFEDVMSAISSAVEATGTKIRHRPKAQRLPDDVIHQYHRDNAEDAVRGLLYDTLETASLYLGKMNSPLVRDVVVQGNFGGKVLNRRNRKLKAALAKELVDNQAFRDALPGLRLSELIEPGFFQRFTTRFFSTAGQMRDMVTLHPFMREVYAEEVVRLAAHMTPKARARMAQNLRNGGDEKLAKKVEAERGAEGWMTADIVEDIADARARARAEQEFYNAANRRNWALALRWVSPFAQAAVNSTYRWGKAMAKDPISAYRTARGLEGIKNFQSAFMGHYEPDLDTKMGVEGFIDRDEWGEETFVYPLVGKGAGLITGQTDPIAAAFTASSVNIQQTGFVTGWGPSMRFALSVSPFRDIQTRDGIAADFMRFWDKYPLDMSKGGQPLQKAVGAFVPAKWINFWNQDEGRVTQMAQALVAARLSRGEYGRIEGWSKNDAEVIARDVEADAVRVLRYEAIAEIFAPLLGSYQTSPLIMKTGDLAKRIGDQDDPKAVLDFMIAAEYQAYVQDSKGEERAKRIALFMRDWGEALPIVAQSTNQSSVTTNIGEGTEFAMQHPQMYEKYRNVIGYLLPKGDYNEEYRNVDRFLREKDKAEGRIKPRTVKEQVEHARQAMLQLQKEQRLIEAGNTKADDYEDVVRAINDEFEQLGLEGYQGDYYSGLEASIRQAVNDPQVLGTLATATYVKEYYSLRDEVVSRIRENSDYAGDLSAKGVWEEFPEVRKLYLTAAKAASEDKGFAHFWVAVGEKEYGDAGSLYL